MIDFLCRLFGSQSYEPDLSYVPPPEFVNSGPIRVTSAVEGAEFVGNLTVRWRGGSEMNRDTVFVAIKDYIARKARNYRVTAANDLAAQVNARGATFEVLEGTGLLISFHVTLTASEESLAVTAAWEEAKRQETVDELRQRQELRQLRYLRDEIFRRPDIARMYWHAKHPTDLTALASPAFEQVAALLNGHPATTPSREVPPVAALIGEFIAGLDGDERGHLIDQLDVVFRAFNRADLAERLPSGAATAVPAAPLPE